MLVDDLNVGGVDFNVFRRHLHHLYLLDQPRVQLVLVLVQLLAAQVVGLLHGSSQGAQSYAVLSVLLAHCLNIMGLVEHQNGALQPEPLLIAPDLLVEEVVVGDENDVGSRPRESLIVKRAEPLQLCLQRYFLQVHKFPEFLLLIERLPLH